MLHFSCAVTHFNQPFGTLLDYPLLVHRIQFADLNILLLPLTGLHPNIFLDSPITAQSLSLLCPTLLPMPTSPPPFRGTSLATTPMPSVPSTCTSSVTTPTAAPPLVLTVRPEPTFETASREDALLTYLSVNPFGKPHGAPDDSDRHVGDLGNFKTDAEGNAVGSKQDKLVKLIGAESVLGVSSPRALGS